MIDEIVIDSNGKEWVVLDKISEWYIIAKDGRLKAVPFYILVRDYSLKQSYGFRQLVEGKTK